MRMTKDLMRVDTIIAPVAVGTTGTGQVGRVVDRRKTVGGVVTNYRGVNLIAGYGAITSTAAIFTAVVKEGDATGAMTSVADADMIGTEADLGLGAAVRTDFTGDKVYKRISYKGTKRYVSVNISSTATAGAIVGCVAEFTDPDQAPTP